MNPQTVLCTTSELAKRYGVHPATVRKWVADGLVKPAITTPGGHFRFDAEADLTAPETEQ